MNRKWMIWVIAPAVALVLTACPKKEPVTAPEEIDVDTTAVEPTEPQPQEIETDRDLARDDMQEEALPSDVEELNRVLRERGLIQDVYFEFDASELSEEAQNRLRGNAAWLRQNAGYSATIEGHCDERGTSEYNLALGEQRANSAQNYITSLGVDGSRLRTLSYGKERPVCNDSSESCWARNRRAHFVIRPN